jgi:hypothetical protein
VSLGAQGAGVYGIALATNGLNYGVYGKTASANGVGVYALHQNPTTNGSVTSVKSHSSAVLGESSNGYGVAGISDNSVGVVGASGSSTGVLGTSTNSMGVYGSSQTSIGVYGSSVSGTAVYGSSFSGDAVYASSFWGFGVDAYSQDGAGVSGFSSDGFAGVVGGCNDGSGVSGYSITGVGVHAESESGLPLEIQSYSTNNTDSLIEAYQSTASNVRRFRVTAGGEVYASGAFHPNGADFAEMLPAQEALEPGDVLVIGENGKLTRSTEACQESVAGVHATKPGLLGGAPDGADLAGKVPLAVVGVVPVKVTNQNGSIKPGDKLTASSTAGHAMKAGKGAKVGTVIGKALTALEGKQGVIQMLVVLQ